LKIIVFGPLGTLTLLIVFLKKMSKLIRVQTPYIYI